MTDQVFNVLICILALLVGILIGQTYRKWKQRQEAEKPKSLREAMGMKPSSSGKAANTPKSTGTTHQKRTGVGKPSGGGTRNAAGGNIQNAAGGNTGRPGGNRS